MSVTLRQLRAFVGIARHRGFTAAARHLHLTQSALSHLVREMEGQLGARLLDRSTRGLSLTPAGTELVQRAELILAEVDDTVERMRDLVAVRRGRVAVAAPPVLSASLLPTAIASFKRRFSGVTLKVLDLLTGQILDAVRCGEADIGLGTFRKGEADIALQPLYEDRLVAVVPASAAMARKRRIRWRELRSENLITLSADSAFHSLVGSAASEAGITASSAYEVRYMGTALGLVEAGLGVAVLPAYAARTANPANAAVRPLEGPVVTRQICVATRAGRSLPPASGAFMEVLKDAFRSMR